MPLSCPLQSARHFSKVSNERGRAGKISFEKAGPIGRTRLCASAVEDGKISPAHAQGERGAEGNALKIYQKELQRLRTRLDQNIFRMKIGLVKPRIVGAADEPCYFLNGPPPG